MTHKHATRALALGLGFLCSLGAFAQGQQYRLTRQSALTERNFIAEVAPGDQRITLSPLADGIALGTGIGAALIAELLLPAATELQAAPDESKLPGFDAWACRAFDPALSKASTAAVGIAALWPATFAFIGERDELLPAAAACAESLAWTYAAKEVAKALFPRPRPYAYKAFPLSEELREEANESFLSGHTALAFSAATSFAVMALKTAPDEGATPWLVAGGYAAAAAAGALRVASGEHFTSDVIAGALLGSAIGWATATLHIELDDETGGDSLGGLSLSAAAGPSLVFTLSY